MQLNEMTCYDMIRNVRQNVMIRNKIDKHKISVHKNFEDWKEMRM